MTAMIPMDFEEEKPDPKAPNKLDDTQLRSILESEMRQAVNHSTSQIAIDQEKALQYYEGQPFGNEVAGSSQVVLRDVAETVDWALPAILRAFFYTNEVVRYEATTPDGEAAAAIQTKVVNEIFREQLRGFRVVYDWAKAGLLEQFATVKFWVEQVREPQIGNAEGLSEMELLILDQQPDVEIMEATPRAALAQDPVTGAPIQTEVWDVRVKTWRTFHRLRLETVPPEEFLCSRSMRRLDQEAPFVAQQKRMTRSELVSLGIPWEDVADLPPAQGLALSDGRADARESDFMTQSGAHRADKASQYVTFTESYIRVDYDGDGYSELRRVWSGGDSSQTILDHDYAPMHGFAGWTPIPMPHQLYGRGYWNIVSDLQEIRSTIARQLLDNIYRTNNARHKMIAEEVDLDSYLDSAPGAPVLVERMESLEALEVPGLQSWAFEMLQYLEKAREQRTGIHPYNQESYAAGQNQTAQGVSQVFEAAMAQVQLLCQIFAESGLTDLFRIIPRAMKAAGMGPGQIKVGEEWIPYDPQMWPDDVRVCVQVGLSPGQSEQRLQRLMLILGLQKEALQAFGDGVMVTPELIYNTAVRIVEQSGFQNPGAFYVNPAGKPLPPPPPNPDMVNAEVEAKNKQAQRALDLSKLEFEREKEAKQTERLEREAAMNHQREMARIEMEERVERYRIDRGYEASITQSQVALAESSQKATTDATAQLERQVQTAEQKAVLSSITDRVARIEQKPRRTRRSIERDEQGRPAALIDEDISE